MSSPSTAGTALCTTATPNSASSIPARWPTRSAFAMRHPTQLTEREKAVAESFVFPSMRPFPDSRWRMIDQVDALVPDGGPHGLGNRPGEHARRSRRVVFQGPFPR